MTAERVITRAHTWIAFDGNGTAHWEIDYGSISQVPTPIARLAVVGTADPDTTQWHAVAAIPKGATPVCFWRTSIEVRAEANTDGDAGDEVGRSAITVIGWERDSARMLLWCHADGSVLMTDGEIAE